MVERKGIGYVIEAFVSSLVVMIFVLSSFNSIAEPQKDWNEFRDRVTAEDATYVLQKTGYTEKFLDSGDMQILQDMGASMTESRLSLSGSVSGPPVGTYTVGMFARDDEDFVIDLEDVSSGDRCYNDLEEIDSEYTIQRTTPSSIFETRHDTRVYFADQDPEITGGFNGERDFDVQYVDKAGECQFSAEEGPHSLVKIISIEENQENAYQVEELNSTIQEATIYEADLAYDLNRILPEYESAEIQFDKFQFSDEEFRSHEMIIFTSNTTLNNIYANRATFLSYAGRKPVLLNMHLNGSQLNSGIMQDIGFSKVNLTQTSPASKEPSFSDTEDSQRIKNYMNVLGFKAVNVNVEPDNISSLEDGRIKEKPLIGSSNFNYKTGKWDSTNSSMKNTNNAGVSELPGLPESSCTDPHHRGTFSFPTKNGQKDLDVFTTKLDGSASSCMVYGVSIDKDKSGVIEEDEKTFLNQETEDIVKRKYQVRILASDHVTFKYLGSDRVEYLNQKKKYKGRKFAGIGRMPEINSSSSSADKALLSSSMLYMLEGENSFGRSSEGGESVSRSVMSKSGIYTVTTRWTD